MTTPDAPRHVVVIGLMGAGKSTLASGLAERLGRPYRDSDTDIEQRAGETGGEIAARDGVDVLHDWEERVLLDALAADEPSVISAAGWTVEADVCRQAMAERAIVILTEVDPQEVVRRKATGVHRRVMDLAEVERLWERRRPMMHSLANLVVDGMQPSSACVDIAADWLHTNILS